MDEIMRTGNPLRDILTKILVTRGLTDVEYGPIDADLIVMDLEREGYIITLSERGPLK